MMHYDICYPVIELLLNMIRLLSLRMEVAGSTIEPIHYLYTGNSLCMFILLFIK